MNEPKLPTLGGEMDDALRELRYIAARLETEAAALRVKISLLAPKPAPRPSYAERLIEALADGQCKLPYNAANRRLEWSESKQHWVIMQKGPGYKVGFWDADLLGPLPPREEGDPTTIDLAPIRAAINQETT